MGDGPNTELAGIGEPGRIRGFLKQDKAGIWRRGQHPHGGSEDERRRPREITGVPTDQKLLQHFFEAQDTEVHAIATDTFMDKSRDEYNAAWLSRELIQNFVDHNPDHPGTLDGVRFTSEDIPGGGKRFRIEGQWPFADPTGVLSPHSDKPDMNTAGGNGIGLKQAAIRFIRDFGVEKFEIDGEGWNVDYQLAKADDINQQWQSVTGQPQNPEHQVKHDWLIAKTEQTDNRGTNAYVIETTNPELIQALEQLPTLGVSMENPYLQHIDYQNEFGAIKWLPRPPRSEDTLDTLKDSLVPPKGRLFINGQVMNYKHKGNTAEDYWEGPEMVTIQLNNIEYRMTVDRPPVNPYELKGYLHNMVYAMTKEEILEQLKNSESIWAGLSDSSFGDRLGAAVVIEQLAQMLSWKGYDTAEWQEHFGGKKYIAWDRDITESQIRELEGQGYIACPEYFKDLGMDKASSKLNLTEIASNVAPRLPQYERERMAQEYGMTVAGEIFPDVTNPEEFIQLLGERLADETATVEVKDSDPNIVRIMLRQDIPRNLLFHPLPNPKDTNQKLLYLIRGMAVYGLKKEVFQKIYTSQRDFVTTFSLDYDAVTNDTILIARNVPNSSNTGAFIEVELTPQYAQQFKDAFQRERTQTNQQAKDSTRATAGSETADGVPVSVADAASGETTAPADADPTIVVKAIGAGAWTHQQEALYRLAIQKRQQNRSLTEAELDIIQQREDLKRQFAEIPIDQPQIPTPVNRDDEVIEKRARVSAAERIRVEEMDKALPGVLEAVEKLEQLVPEPGPQAPTGTATAFEKYVQWRGSQEFYGQLGTEAGYLTGKHLFELLEQQNHATIKAVEVERTSTPEDHIRDALRARLKNLLDQMNTREDDVDEFDIVLEPSEKQLAQLGLLRLYTQLATGVALPNDLFIYEGTGSKGINLGKKAIGMHESLFSVKFSEAMRTFIHEVAHNSPEAEGHDNLFRHAMESLFAITIDRVSEIADNLEANEPISQEERIILDMRREWDKLRAA